MGEAPHVSRQRTEHAREELASDLQALTDKLNVKKQVDRKRSEVVDKAKGALGMRDGHGNQAQEEAGVVISTIAAHPLATLAFGYGAATLLKGWRSKHSKVHGAQATHTRAMALPPYTTEGGATYAASSSDSSRIDDVKSAVASKADGLKTGASDMKDTVGVKAAEVKDTVGASATAVKDAVSDQVSNVGGAISSQAHSVADTVTRVAPTSMPELERMVRSNLPAFGIGAFAAGAIAGLVLPRTAMEDERFGEMRDQLVSQVQEKALEAKDAVQHGLTEGVSEVKTAVQESVSTVKDTAKEDMGLGGDEEGDDDLPALKGKDVSSSDEDLLIRPLDGMSDGTTTPAEGLSGTTRPSRITGSRGLGGSTDSLDAPQSTPVGSDFGSP